MRFARSVNMIRPQSLIALVATLAVLGLVSFIPSQASLPSQAPQTGAYSLLDAVFVPQEAAAGCKNLRRCTETQGGHCTPAWMKTCTVYGNWCFTGSGLC